MGSFRVRLTRDVTESVDVVVEAASVDEANEKALEVAGRYGENLDGWSTDEGNQSEVYLPDELSFDLDELLAMGEDD